MRLRCAQMMFEVVDGRSAGLPAKQEAHMLDQQLSFQREFGDRS